MTFTVKERRASALAAVAPRTSARAEDWRPEMPVDRETYARWYAQVHEIAPKNEAVTWLHLAWEPGDPWRPVNRWCVWQMRPAETVLPQFRAELDGPHPRSTGHYCADGYCECAVKMHAWRGGTSALIDATQWALYHSAGPAAGCFGRRFWIVQGQHGGNLRWFTQTQSKLSRIAGGPEHPPVPGSLCYAPVDHRVLAQLAEHDKMRRYGLMTDFLLRSPEQIDAEDREGHRIAKRELQRWIGTQMRELVSEGGRALMRQLAAQPRPVGLTDTTDYDREFALLAADEDDDDA